MKHRGRHRRRRRGAALRAALTGTALALTAAATLISTSQAEVAEDPGALTPLTSPADTGRLRLQERLVPGRSLDRLAAAMGRPVGVDAVLRDADRRMREADDCSADDRASLPVAPAPARAYCWDPADTAGDWRPVSVTTSGDAGVDGVRGTHRVVLAGWTHSDTAGRPGEQGLARVAFVNADDPARLSYRWVLPVVPVDGGRDYRGLASGVSGMVWHKDKLLVTTASGGADALYVYDLDRIQRTTVDAPAIGRVPGGWSAAGYDYVLPAVASYRFAAGRCSASGPPCPGALALDRGTAPDSLVAAEWTAPDDDRRARLWRYAFDTDPARPGLLATDGTGGVDAVEAYRTRAAGIRGVLSYREAGADRPSWYVGRLRGTQDGRGGLWRQDTRRTRETHCGADASDRCWARGAGSLSYWRETGEVWSLSDRMLFALPLAGLDRSLD
ncbi:hypothetical protein [Streptomyces rubradiris]|uniref:Secreted protein n=1 Tax=Streptomyces rubradiris TaxID=285531 RepID=A0ABQ3RFB3_STRRR|nr:hypothetical protein [Streptomyces rubradiris]GHG96927.1 hypothetical protein GCM10018792_08370 [Streptomyces rubradiris]GHI54545.1 hypothetical protein Srubr_43910 [Streptomyces rubradiris]